MNRYTIEDYLVEKLAGRLYPTEFRIPHNRDNRWHKVQRFLDDETMKIGLANNAIFRGIESFEQWQERMIHSDHQSISNNIRSIDKTLKDLYEKRREVSNELNKHETTSMDQLRGLQSQLFDLNQEIKKLDIEQDNLYLKIREPV